MSDGNETRPEVDESKHKQDEQKIRSEGGPRLKHRPRRNPQDIAGPQRRSLSDRPIRLVPARANADAFRHTYFRPIGSGHEHDRLSDV